MLYMTLSEIETRYTEAKDKKEQIGILADLNDVETTFMTMLLREMGHDVCAEKMPRKSRDGGDPYELFQLKPEYAEAVKWREDHGREIGRVVGYTAKENKQTKKPEQKVLQNVEQSKATKPKGEPKKGTDTKLDEGLRLAIYMWGSYLEYTHEQTITRDDVSMLERLIGMTGER